MFLFTLFWAVITAQAALSVTLIKRAGSPLDPFIATLDEVLVGEDPLASASFLEAISPY
jgi:hypothetical protein